ncbi:MAG: hypothetical protein GX596_02955, partial [Propionibacterium sp.]|nr:hypothetical protein [Propionibacterium sp.]
GWDWDLDSAPVPSDTPLGLDGVDGSYEGAYLVSSLADGTAIRVLLDTGAVDLYGNGYEAQDLPSAELRKFFTQEVLLDFAGAFTDGGVDDDRDDEDDRDGAEDGDDREPVSPGLPSTGL